MSSGTTDHLFLSLWFMAWRLQDILFWHLLIFLRSLNTAFGVLQGLRFTFHFNICLRVFLGLMNILFWGSGVRSCWGRLCSARAEGGRRRGRSLRWTKLREVVCDCAGQVRVVQWSVILRQPSHSLGWRSSQNLCCEMMTWGEAEFLGHFLQLLPAHKYARETNRKSVSKTIREQKPFFKNIATNSLWMYSGM